MNINEIGCQGVAWMELRRERIQWWDFVSVAFLNQLRVTANISNNNFYVKYQFVVSCTEFPVTDELWIKKGAFLSQQTAVAHRRYSIKKC